MYDYRLYFLKHRFLQCCKSKIGAPITEQSELFRLAEANKCVYWNGKHRPAKWVLNMNFQQVVAGLKNGAFRHYDQKALPAHVRPKNRVRVIVYGASNSGVFQ